MSVLLCDAGVPPLEKGHEKRYGKDPEYQQYKAATSLIVPWPKLNPSLPPAKDN